MGRKSEFDPSNSLRRGTRPSARRTLVRIHRLAFVLFAWFTGLTATDAAEAQTTFPSPASAAASSADGTLTVAGEHFTVRRVIDHQQNELVAEVFQAPQSWTDRSDVR